MAINKKYLDLEGLEHYEATIKSRLGAEANTRLSADNNLQAQINGLASGSPLVASSISEMTDTTRVYVNTTDGHWYYYNGSAWTDGGVYQAAENSDLMNGLIYNQVNENLKYLITPAAGNINNNTGAVAGTANQIITSEIQRFSYDLYIPYDSFSNINVYYYDDNGAFIRVATSVANPNKGYRIPANSNFRLKVDYHTVPSGGRPTITGDIEDTELFQNFSIMPYAVHKQIQLAKLRTDGYQQDPENLKYQLDLEIGDIDATGFNPNSNNYRRLATVNILHYDFDVVLPKTNAFVVYPWTYTDQSGSGASGQGWKNLSTDEFTIAAGTYFRLVIAKTTSYAEPLYDIYDNDIYKVFALYKKTESAEPVIPDIIQYNPNMRSVAHQGYSVIDSEFYGNCRLSSYIGAKEHGFDYGECDVKFSSDGVPVCSHDTTFTDSTTGVSVNITEHTWAELQTYNYHHERLASLEQVLSKCKELGLGLYIDHLSGNWSDAYWNTIFGLVKKLQMQDNVYWLQAPARNVTNRILSWYSRAKIVLVVGSNDLTSVITEANAIKTDFNEVSVDFNYAQITVAQMQSYAAQLETGVQLEIWTVDNATDYKSYLPYARGITSNKICYNDVYEDLLG